MKNFFICFIACSLFATISCKKENCEPGSLSETLIGEWRVSALGTTGDVEFRADGTLIDNDDVLIGGETGTGEPLNQKSYTVNGDTGFTTTATDAGGSFTISFDYDVTDFNCDEIEIEVLGFGATMTRK